MHDASRLRLKIGWKTWKDRLIAATGPRQVMISTVDLILISGGMKRALSCINVGIILPTCNMRLTWYS
jgi:hypothetical protein